MYIPDVKTPLSPYVQFGPLEDENAKVNTKLIAEEASNLEAYLARAGFMLEVPGVTKTQP